jgi:hypothetical protein
MESRVKIPCFQPKEERELACLTNAPNYMNVYMKEKKCLILLKYIRQLERCVNREKWVEKSFKTPVSTLMDNHS